MVPMGRYVDPLTDFGFNRVFGPEPHKDQLTAFLNELFKGRKIIRGLVYNPQDATARRSITRKTILELICTGTKGETFIIEMQRAGQQFFTDRAFFTLCQQIIWSGGQREISIGISN